MTDEAEGTRLWRGVNWARIAPIIQQYLPLDRSTDP